MHLLELNEDVLQCIVSVMSQRELIKLAATCHSAHEFCIPHFISTIHLSDVGAPLRMDDLIRNFCQFMLAHPTKRIPYLRHFSLNPTRFLGLWDFYDRSAIVTSPSFATLLDALVEVLDQACNLQTFEVQSCESLLTREPRIAGALARCPHLTTISLDNVSSAPSRTSSCTMMEILTGIRHINLGLVDSHDLLLLHRFRLTLESLSFHCSAGYNVTFSDACQWPNVMHLKVYIRDPPTSIDLARAFPNIRKLHVDGNEPNAIETSEALHRECWSHLDYVEGPMSALYVIGLTGTIRELRVTRSLTHSEPKQPIVGCIRRTDAFLNLVRLANPETLSFADDLRSKLADVQFFHELANAASSLKFLTISVTFSTKVFRDLTASLRSLQSVPIVFFSLCFQGRAFEKAKTLSEEQVQTVLDTIKSSIPSVEYVELANMGTYWAVKEDGNSRHLHRISQAQGELRKKRWLR